MWLTQSLIRWQCHLLSCQTLVWTAKKMYVMELICCKLRRVDRNYLQKTWDVHLGVIIITNPLVLQIYDDDADHFSDWDIDDDEFTHHNSDDDGNDDVNHRTVALNLLMLMLIFGESQSCVQNIWINLFAKSIIHTCIWLYSTCWGGLWRHNQNFLMTDDVTWSCW